MRNVIRRLTGWHQGTLVFASTDEQGRHALSDQLWFRVRRSGWVDVDDDQIRSLLPAAELIEIKEIR